MFYYLPDRIRRAKSEATPKQRPLGPEPVPHGFREEVVVAVVRSLAAVSCPTVHPVDMQ